MTKEKIRKNKKTKTKANHKRNQKDMWMTTWTVTRRKNIYLFCIRQGNREASNQIFKFNFITIKK